MVQVIEISQVSPGGKYLVKQCKPFRVLASNLHTTGEAERVAEAAKESMKQLGIECRILGGSGA